MLLLVTIRGQSAAPEALTAVDHHQHLFSPATISLATGISPVSADDLVRLLDEARIARAVVLSLAYQFGNPNRPPVADEYAKVRAENDWTSREVGRFPDRLRGFCGVNPLKAYAVSEIARCSRDAGLRSGLKLHFGNSDVDLDDLRHVAAVRAVFEAANTHRMAILVHMRSSVTRTRPYGARQANVFLDAILPGARDVPVQIAHLAGAGGYDDPSVDEALAVFIEAIARKDVRTAHLYFDVSGVAGLGEWARKAGAIATRIRQLGVQRVLYGSDGTTDVLRPRDAHAAFRQLPLTADEFGIIERNVAPYLR